MLWNFTVQTDHIIEVRLPDIVVLDKKMGYILVTVITVNDDVRVKERENLKYQS